MSLRKFWGNLRKKFKNSNSCFVLKVNLKMMYINILLEFVQYFLKN